MRFGDPFWSVLFHIEYVPTICRGDFFPCGSQSKTSLIALPQKSKRIIRFREYDINSARSKVTLTTPFRNILIDLPNGMVCDLKDQRTHNSQNKHDDKRGNVIA